MKRQIQIATTNQKFADRATIGNITSIVEEFGIKFITDGYELEIEGMYIKPITNLDEKLSTFTLQVYPFTTSTPKDFTHCNVMFFAYDAVNDKYGRLTVNSPFGAEIVFQPLSGGDFRTKEFKEFKSVYGL